MTENDIQLALREYRGSISAFPIMIPNVYHWGWESDLLYITKSLYPVEYEIKISLSDFNADFTKERKHNRIGSLLPEPYSTTNMPVGPREFWYACPDGLIPLELVPPYAGLIYVSTERKDGWEPWYALAPFYIKILRRAPRRNVPKVSTNRLIELLSKAGDRYWSKALHCAQYHQTKKKNCGVISQPQGDKDS